MNKGALLCILSILLGPGLKAQEADSLSNTLSSYELMPVFNPWLQSTNAAGMHFNPELQCGNLELSYQGTEGAYKRAQQGLKQQHFSIQTGSYKKLGESWLHGSFSYDKSFEKDCNYTLINDPYRGSPYLLIDTLNRNDIYDREFFSFSGKLSTPFTSWLAWGASVDIDVGLSAQDRDPRPRNKLMNLDLSTGVVLGSDQVFLGLNMLYSYYNEDIEVDIIEQNTQHTFFLLHGFDRYNYHVAASYNRLYKRNTLGGEAQLSLMNDKGLKSILGFQYLTLGETADDGRRAGDASWSYIKNDSYLEGSVMRLYTASTLRHGSFLHHIHASFSLNNMLGTEILQRLEQVGEAGAVAWVEYGREEKYGSTLSLFDLNYRFLIMKDRYARNLELRVGMKGEGFEQRYSLPSRLEAYRNRIYSASAVKSFYPGRHEINFSLGIRLKKNVSEELDIDESSFLSQMIQLPDHDFLSSDYFAPWADLSYAYHLNRNISTFFAGVKLEQFKGSNELERTMIYINTGVTF